MEREITSQAVQRVVAAADHGAPGGPGAREPGAAGEPGADSEAEPSEAEPGAAGETEAVGEQHAIRSASGDLRVDHALRGLDDLADLPVSEHPAVFERIHGQLVEVLGELRSGPGKGGYGRQAD